MDIHALLADFLSPSYTSLFDIARRHGLNILELAEWFQLPATQALLAQIEAMNAARARLMINQEAVIGILGNIASRPLAPDASATAVETARRAVSQLLRFSTPPAPAKTKPRASQADQSHSVGATPSARGEAAEVGRADQPDANANSASHQSAAPDATGADQPDDQSSTNSGCHQSAALGATGADTTRDAQSHPATNTPRSAAAAPLAA